MIVGRILIIAVMIVLAGGWSVDISAYQVLGGPTSVTSQGTVPFLGPQALLDDFATNSTLNKWNCATGAFGSTLSVTTQPGYCTASWDPAGQALKLDYDVRYSTSYSGYYSQMGGGNLTSPTAYTAVSFLVKGAVGGEFFKVELKNTNSLKYWDATEATNYYRNTASVYVNDFHEDGKVTTAWRKVTIPLKNFVNLDSFSSMKEIVFTFENNMSSQNSSPTQGTIYIDNITFETTPVSAIKVDSFKDKVTVNSLGGNMGVTGNGTASLSFAPMSDAYHTCLNALKYDFNVSATYSYTAAFFIFGGGYTDNTVEKPDKGGWIKVLQNFNAFNAITFWARAETDAKNPVGFKVELHDFVGTGDGEPFYKIEASATNHLTASWQKYTIPFTNFKDWPPYQVPLDKSRISELVFTIEERNTPLGHEIGTIYIDDIRFE